MNKYLKDIDEDRRPHRAETIAPIAQLLGKVNEARVPLWRREYMQVPLYQWCALGVLLLLVVHHFYIFW